MLRKLIAALTAGGIGLVALLASAAPAHAYSVTQGRDYAIHSYDGYAFEICDMEDDGHAVWAGFYTTQSNKYQTLRPIYLGNAAGPDCLRIDMSYQLTNIRVVEDKPGSSNNWYGAWHGYPVAGT